MNPTAIEWTHVFGPGSGFTWNPVVGCTNGCTYCYARRVAKRQPCALCKSFTPHLHEERLEQPLHRKKRAGIFICSMGDLWDRHVPQAWRDRVWEVVAATPQHVYWVLTKQPQNFTGPDHEAFCHNTNLWVGITVTQGRVQRGAPMHGNTFVSIEPLLGEIVWDSRLRDWAHWLIIGAQTGPGAKPPSEDQVQRVLNGAWDWFTPAIFLKRNLIPVMGERYVRAHQQWPVEMQGRE